MRRRLIVVVVCAGFVPGVLYAETCIKSSLNVTYTCNGGRVVGTLPGPTTATYAQTFSPERIPDDACEPPSGYVRAGTAIIVNGKEVVYSYRNYASYLKFTNYYTTDFEVAPHWVPEEFNQAAFYAVMSGSTNMDTVTEYGYASSGTLDGTWGVETPFGHITGKYRCSKYQPESTASGAIPDQQELITAVEYSSSNKKGTQHCYCMLTKPYSSGARWIYQGKHSGNTSIESTRMYCWNYCPRLCSGFNMVKAAIKAMLLE